MGADSAQKSLCLSDPVVCVVGPTASGKTALAQALAYSLDGEVVSADSMQVYRGMDIGTGKLPIKERVVAHYGFDLVDPGDPFSAAVFQAYARDCFCKSNEQGKRSILCGGTGLYVRAAIDAYDFPQGEQVQNDVRNHYSKFAEAHGSDTLWKLLSERDPASAALVFPADVRRVIRAFELLESGGSYAEQRRKLANIPQFVPAIFIGLAVDPVLLNARIDKRVDEMLKQGLICEVQELLSAGFREGITAPQAIGYKEIVAALDGKTSMEEAVMRIKIATHRYAKRQRTWFRKEKRIHWLCADEQDISSLTAQALELVSRVQSKRM